MITFAIKILTDPLFPLVTLLLGFLIGHRLAIGRDKRNDFNKAASIFRDTFLPERLLLDIRHAPDASKSNSAMEIIEPAIPRHTEAMLRFIDNLSWWKQICFTRAWNKYAHYKVKGEPDTPFLAMYFEDKWEGRDTKELAIERIEKILKFAEPK